MFNAQSLPDGSSSLFSLWLSLSVTPSSLSTSSLTVNLAEWTSAGGGGTVHEEEGVNTCTTRFLHMLTTQVEAIPQACAKIA